MARPVLLAVDDEKEVLRAVERDLRKRFSDRLKIVGAPSAEVALNVLRELKERGEDVALILTDQRMPHMSGVELLEQANPVFPDAKRVLLTAYSDTEAAIRAINGAKVDYYLLKPWDPPEEKLFPILEDLLDDWFAEYEPPFEGIRIYGHRWSPETHMLKDFLSRNQIPYQWIDVEAEDEDPEVRKILESAPGKLPLVTLPDGPCLENPTLGQLAERIGLNRVGIGVKAQSPSYDFAIVGGGPAGLAAAVYGASEGLKTVLVECDAVGGQAGSSSLIENYLGFPRGLSGAELARRARDQAIRFHVEILAPQEAVELCEVDGYRILGLADGQRITSRALLLATGVSYRRLNVPGEERLFGKGVYYGAALSEAISCVDERVVIIGGANSAGQAAMHFSRYAGHVTMLVRGAGLSASMSKYLIDRIEQTPNIEVRTHTEAREFQGEDRLEAVCVEGPNGAEVLRSDGVFIFIGAEPHTDWVGERVLRDAKGFVLTGSQVLNDERGKAVWPLKRPPMLLETSFPGVFAAGDVRAGSVKRVASGVGHGSIAVQLVHEYLKEVKA